MAGPSIMVRILADLTGLSKATSSAGKTAEGAASRMHGAFSSVLGQLNATGVLGPFGEALDGVDQALDSIEKHGKDVGLAMIGVGGAIAGVGIGLQSLGSKDKAAHAQLQSAVEATGHDYEDYAEKVENAIKVQERFGTSAATTQDALRILTQAMGDPMKALDYLGTAADLAAAKNESLTVAATQLGQAYNGSTKLLKQFGIEAAPKAATATKALDTATKAAATATEAYAKAKQKAADLEAIDAGKKKLTTAQSIRLRDAQQAVTAAASAAQAAAVKLAAAEDAVKKATTAQTDTMTALSDKLKGQASDAADTFAGKLDAIKARVEDSAAQFGQKYGPAITYVGGAITALGSAIEATMIITEAFRAVMASTVVTELLMIGPIILVVAALAALGVAAYVIYRNWGTIWKGMKAAAVDVWNWIKNNWPYLVGIILGPIALAAAIVYKHWATVKAGAAAVYNWFVTTWRTLTGYITAPFDAAWGAIENAFRGMVNAIIDIWNGLHFTLPKINEGPIHLGGETIGVPRIPHLSQGGLITSTGLIYAHAGEAITPAKDVGPRGPAVVLQNAHFSSDVDVEAFMRKAAWVVQTQRI